MKSILVVLNIIFEFAILLGKAEAVDAALIYRKWFFSKDESTNTKFQFRLYSNEVGTARTIFTLICDKEASYHATVELLPPTSLEQVLQELGKSEVQKTKIQIATEQNVLIDEEGEFDKISAFLDFSVQEKLFDFLKIFNTYEKLTVIWDIPKFEYLIMYSPVYANQFKSLFMERLRNSNYEEMSFQNVYLKCSSLF